MGKITGFLEIDRLERAVSPVSERVGHYREFVSPLGDAETAQQAARCMDCGVPYCHTGCPVNNEIPDWNDLVWTDAWRDAAANLHETNNFPEFTGRVCPAPCEAACTLNFNDDPVAIKAIECAIADKAWESGWVVPRPAEKKSGRSVGVVGSGPAGLACAQQLARAGHEVHVYEKHAKAGGLLRYGIPDFKMEKHLVDRRVEQMEAEGVVFHYGAHIGHGEDAENLCRTHDAVVLCGGSEHPRDLPVEGRGLSGVHFAMDFLTQQNRRVGGEQLGDVAEISAKGRHVVVIGGGDTGSDCIGTSFRQGAASVTQMEILPIPPEHEDKNLTWPDWPLKLRTSSSQEEGAVRDFSVMTRAFDGEDGRVARLQCVRVDDAMAPVEGSGFALPADLVLLAMGFVHPVFAGMLEGLGVSLDEKGNVRADMRDYRTSREGIFAAGDMRRGQSLVVWAIREGRECAAAVDGFLGEGADSRRGVV